MGQNAKSSLEIDLYMCPTKFQKCCPCSSLRKFLSTNGVGTTVSPYAEKNKKPKL